jgi:hypothetical protein
MTQRTPDLSATAPPRARLKLTLMFLMPALAVLLATLVFYSGFGIPHHTTNKGVLIQPPRQIDEASLAEANGKPWQYQTEAHAWGMLLTGGASCDQVCSERLYLSRQVRKALGRDTERVNRFYLATQLPLDPALQALLDAEHPDVRVIYAPDAALNALLGRPGDPDPLQTHPTYLVDPRGFVMMYYLPAQGGADIIKDLRFLLRNSAG